VEIFRMTVVEAFKRTVVEIFRMTVVEAFKRTVERHSEPLFSSF